MTASGKTFGAGTCVKRILRKRGRVIIPAALACGRTCGRASTQAEQVVLQEYYADGTDKAPRYYQVNAVNSAIEAIAGVRNRRLLFVAAGTGKTHTAFQIIWRLWKAGRAKRVHHRPQRALAQRESFPSHGRGRRFNPYSAHHSAGLFSASAGTNRQHSARVGTLTRGGDVELCSPEVLVTRGSVSV